MPGPTPKQVVELRRLLLLPFVDLEQGMRPTLFLFFPLLTPIQRATKWE
jgi:hypothetical protein